MIGREEVLVRAAGAREQLRLALEATGTATWFFDPERNVVGGDERMKELFSVEQAEGPAAMWLARLHGDDRGRVAAEFAASVSSGSYDTEYRVTAPDGNVRWVRAKARLVSFGAAAAPALVGICEDITWQKRVESERAAAEARLRLAQEAGSIVTWEWDLASGTMLWGGDPRGVWGRDAGELRRVDDIFRMLHPEDVDRVREALEPALAGHGLYGWDFRVIWPDGSVRWLNGRGKPLFAADGSVERLVGANVDVTERRNSDKALLESEKLAAVGRLASTIAHEINNPLESVTNLVFLAKIQPGLPPSACEYLEVAESELRRAAAITAKTLHFYKQLSQPTEVTGGELIHNVLMSYEARLTNHSILLDVERLTERPVCCLEGEIHQVLSNLVGNAIDAMPRGGTLRLRCAESANWTTGEHGLRLTVADTGTGVSREVREHIFEAFYTTKGMSGTGLGLWVSSEIVKRHNGLFRVRSQPGRGTVFTVWLPWQGQIAAS